MSYIKTIDKDARSIRERWDAGPDGQVLTVTTSHDKHRKRIETRVSRSVIRNGSERMVFSMRNEDPNPIIDGDSMHVDRYSFKTLENFHASFLSIHVHSIGQLATHIDWASRAKGGAPSSVAQASIATSPEEK